MIAAIDPGFAKPCAIAYGDHQIVRIDLVHWSAPIPPPPARVDRVYVETPVQRRGSRVPPSVLVDLAFAAGVVAGRVGGTLIRIEPAAWKGYSPKPQTHGRIWAAMSDAERALIPGAYDAIVAAKVRGAKKNWRGGRDWYTQSEQGISDALDAAGIFLFVLGRLT